MIEPLDNRVLAQRFAAKDKTAGGIILPEVSKEKPQKAKVIAVGPGKMLASGERAPMQVEDGDIILIGKYSSTEIEVDGKEYVFLCEEDILARFK